MRAISLARRYATTDFSVDIEDNALRHLWDVDYAMLARRQYAGSNGRLWSGGTAAVTMAHVEANGNVLADPLLSAPAGNIKCESFEQIWQHSKVMNDLRRRDRLTGACGSCIDKFICGGSRARAFGTYANYHAEDPGCPRSLGGAETVLFDEALPIVGVSTLVRRASRSR